MKDSYLALMYDQIPLKTVVVISFNLTAKMLYGDNFPIL